MNNALTAPSWFLRYPAAQFLGALVLALVSSPFTEALDDGDLIEAVRLTVVLLSGLLAVGGRKRILICGIVLAVPALVAKWVNHWQPTWVPDWMFLVPGRLRRHRASVGRGADAGDDGRHDRHALYGGPGRPFGFAIFNAAAIR